MKECIICNSELHDNKKKFCSNKCKQKHHWHRVKEQPNTYHSQTIRALTRKVKLIELMGGCCSDCGYKKNLAALEFHHKIPNDKIDKLDLRILSNRSWDFIITEANKCELLCANCHREKHNTDMLFDNVLIILESHNLKLKDNKQKILQTKSKCLDCNIEIDKKSKRCRVCNYKLKRKVKRPDLTLLKMELDVNGATWCANKYNVSRATIKRWLIKL